MLHTNTDSGHTTSSGHTGCCNRNSFPVTWPWEILLKNRGPLNTHACDRAAPWCSVLWVYCPCKHNWGKNIVLGKTGDADHDSGRFCHRGPTTRGDRARMLSMLSDKGPPSWGLTNPHTHTHTHTHTHRCRSGRMLGCAFSTVCLSVCVSAKSVDYLEH